jgi:DNA-binding IscR family transcriptional regulator
MMAVCDSLLCMAQSGRFGLGVRVLAVLAEEPDGMHTSEVIAKRLKESPVMVRRMFLLLHEGGFTVQRKGPNGGAKLKDAAKEIGLGDVFAACSGEWLAVGEKAVNGLMKRVREDAVAGMNETSLAQVLKRLRKGKA